MTRGKFTISQAAFDARQCRIADKQLFDETMALIDAEDVSALASNVHFPVAAKILQERLPKARGLRSTGVFPVAILYAGGNIMALRLAHAFGIINADATTPTVRQTFNRILAAKGPAADACRTLLTGEGVPDAVLLRRIIELRRGSPLPVFDLGDDGQPEVTEAQMVRRQGALRAAETTRRRRQEEQSRGES